MPAVSRVQDELDANQSVPIREEGEAEKVDTFASTLFNIATFPVRLVGKAIQGVVFVITEGTKAILGTPGKIIGLIKKPFQSEDEIISVGFKKLGEVPKAVTPPVEVSKSLATRVKEIVMTKKAAGILLAGTVGAAAVAAYTFYAPEEISASVIEPMVNAAKSVADTMKSVGSETLVDVLLGTGILKREALLPSW